ncbi:hypothetical protein PS673_02033 [Pseudomonas fluorescens]|uniref:Uncharacterized protein n=1 Tax=Pseudomonas fluorescens TaxID=294 RepID=A0A5E6S705_PSEFL|nr:hypothetical protein PS673_02033 [Pseudomonas fluorescens]
MKLPTNSMTALEGVLKSQVAHGLTSVAYVLEEPGTVDYENGVFTVPGSPQSNTHLTLEAVGKHIGDVA